MRLRALPALSGTAAYGVTIEAACAAFGRARRSVIAGRTATVASGLAFSNGRDKQRALREAGQTQQKSARQLGIEAKRTQLKAWRTARQAEAEARALLPPLNEKQKAEIRTMAWEALDLARD